MNGPFEGVSLSSPPPRVLSLLFPLSAGIARGDLANRSHREGREREHLPSEDVHGAGEGLVALHCDYGRRLRGVALVRDALLPDLPRLEHGARILLRGASRLRGRLRRPRRDEDGDGRCDAARR